MRYSRRWPIQQSNVWNSRLKRFYDKLITFDHFTPCIQTLQPKAIAVKLLDESVYPCQTSQHFNPIYITTCIYKGNNIRGEIYYISITTSWSYMGVPLPSVTTLLTICTHLSFGMLCSFNLDGLILMRFSVFPWYELEQERVKFNTTYWNT